MMAGATAAPQGQDSDVRLYSIGDAAEECGISAETLRIWERRYGRPEPVRLPSGHRRFTEAQVRGLRRVAEALARGFRPGRVLKLTDAEFDELLGPPSGDAPVDPETLKLIGYARDFREKDIRRRLLAAWKREDPLTFLNKRLAPLIAAVGRAWADGDLEVRHEHFLTEVVQDVVRKLRLDLPVPQGSPQVLLTTLSGERHGLGLQMAGLVCATNRISHRILGVDTPIDEIVLAAQELEPRAVGLSVSLATGGVETDRTIAALRKQLAPEVALIVGGAGARGVRRGPRDVTYVEDLSALDSVLKGM